MKIRVSLMAIVIAVMFLAVAYAQEKKERPKLPEGVQGFSGTVQGIVVSIKKGRFVFDVEKVKNVWKNSKAEKPENLAGVKIMVGAKNKEGKHAKFIKTLKVDEALSLEVRNEKGKAFVILELTEEQRKRADEAE